MTEDDQDLLERLEAIIANAWDDDEHETLSEARDRIEAQAAEIERLRKAGAKMSGYAGHDDDCQIMMKGVWGDKTPCDCGYEDAWKALRDALGETE